MSKKWDAIRGSAEFYITMAVCLVVIGVSGYFLLFDGSGDEEIPAMEPTVPTVPTVVEPEQPSEPVVETISPESVEVPVVMPEVEVADVPVVAQAPRLIVMPLEGEVLTAFSMDALVYNPTLGDWRTHDGIDISGALGDAVLSACSGTVLSVEEDVLMGTTVVIEHDGGYTTTYANLDPQVNVTAGETVSAGQIIGAVGDTAAAEAAQEPHLHFSVSQDGEAVNPNTFLER